MSFNDTYYDQLESDHARTLAQAHLYELRAKLELSTLWYRARIQRGGISRHRIAAATRLLTRNAVRLGLIDRQLRS